MIPDRRGQIPGLSDLHAASKRHRRRPAALRIDETTIPGGPLRTGPLAEHGEIDPASVEGRNVELQLVDPPTSRLTGLFFHEGAYYIPCDLGSMRPRIPHTLMRTPGVFAIVGKRWHEGALRDDRVVLRVDGRRYERRVKRVTAPDRLAVLRDLTERKASAFFGQPLRPVATDPDAIWSFRVEPR